MKRLRTIARRTWKCTMMVTVFVFVAVLLMVVGPLDALMGALGLRRKRRLRDAPRKIVSTSAK